MQELELEQCTHLPMTNAIGVKDMDIGQISARHHQCEASGAASVDDEAEEMEEAEARDRAE